MLGTDTKRRIDTARDIPVGKVPDPKAGRADHHRADLHVHGRHGRRGRGTGRPAQVLRRRLLPLRLGQAHALGGTFINKAVGYCQSLIQEPEKTIMVLISDLYEGGVEQELLQRAKEIGDSGNQLIVLLALSGEGHPAYDQALAAKLANLGIPGFACTPDLFPA